MDDLTEILIDYFLTREIKSLHTAQGALRVIPGLYGVAFCETLSEQSQQHAGRFRAPHPSLLDYV